MNILFCDYHGVLNTFNNSMHHDSIAPNIKYLKMLADNVDRLCDIHNLKFVFYSDLLLELDFRFIQIIFEKIGFKNIPIDYVPFHLIEYDNTNELKCFNHVSEFKSLKLKKYIELNNIKKYIIIDDQSDAGIHHENNFFKVDPITGFDNEHFNKCNKMCEFIFTK